MTADLEGCRAALSSSCGSRAEYAASARDEARLNLEDGGDEVEDVLAAAGYEGAGIDVDADVVAAVAVAAEVADGREVGRNGGGGGGRA